MPFGLSELNVQHQVSAYYRLWSAKQTIICRVILLPAHVNSIKQPLKDTLLAPRREHGRWVSENLLVNKLTSESAEKARKHLPATLSIIMERKIVACCLSQCGEINKAGLGQAALPWQLPAIGNSCQEGNYPWCCSPGAVQSRDDVCLETEVLLLVIGVSVAHIPSGSLKHQRLQA